MMRASIAAMMAQLARLVNEVDSLEYVVIPVGNIPKGTGLWAPPPRSPNPEFGKGVWGGTHYQGFSPTKNPRPLSVSENRAFQKGKLLILALPQMLLQEFDYVRPVIS